MIHSLTNIHPNARIAEGVTVESFTTISGDVEIGKGTWIGPNVTIMDGARIGKNCKICYLRNSSGSKVQGRGNTGFYRRQCIDKGMCNSK